MFKKEKFVMGNKVEIINVKILEDVWFFPSTNNPDMHHAIITLSETQVGNVKECVIGHLWGKLALYAAYNLRTGTLFTANARAAEKFIDKGTDGITTTLMGVIIQEVISPTMPDAPMEYIPIQGRCGMARIWTPDIQSHYDTSVVKH